MTRRTVCSLVVLDGDRDGLEPLLRRFPRAAEEQESQHHADPGQHDDGQEGGLEALVQYDERVRIFVCRQ
jgi:hypothetical protein